MYRILTLGLAVPLVATSAWAGNPVFEAPAPAPIEAAPAPLPPAPVLPDWTGAYVGGQIGLGQGEVGDTDADGLIGGVHAGYDYDFGALVVGGAVDLDLAQIELDGDAGEIDRVFRLKGRVGYDLGQALVYGTAGLAHAAAEVGGTDLDDTGAFYGLGLDYRVTDAWTVGAEVLRHSFDDFDDSGADVEVDTLQLRAGFRF
ncbi:MAG: outer membrane beta-barrel protein [Pseudomonadota bacterium]